MSSSSIEAVFLSRQLCVRFIFYDVSTEAVRYVAGGFVTLSAKD